MTSWDKNPLSGKAEQALEDRVYGADDDERDAREGYEDCYADGSLKNECWDSRREAPRKIQTKKP